MGLLQSLLNGQPQTSEDYVELSDKHLQGVNANTETTIYLADVNGQQDVMAIKDVLYDGNIIIAQLGNATAEGFNEKRVKNQLKTCADETGGSIATYGSNQLIVTPRGVSISTKKL